VDVELDFFEAGGEWTRDRLGARDHDPAAAWFLELEDRPRWAW